MKREIIKNGLSLSDAFDIIDLELIKLKSLKSDLGKLNDEIEELKYNISNITELLDSLKLKEFIEKQKQINKDLYSNLNK
jgi:DNA-binding MarR family transcriptional regulator